MEFCFYGFVFKCKCRSFSFSFRVYCEFFHLVRLCLSRLFIYSKLSSSSIKTHFFFFIGVTFSSVLQTKFNNSFICCFKPTKYFNRINNLCSKYFRRWTLLGHDHLIHRWTDRNNIFLQSTTTRIIILIIRVCLNVERETTRVTFGSQRYNSTISCRANITSMRESKVNFTSTYNPIFSISILSWMFWR